MSTCGRCRGRGYVKPTIGFGDQSCPACKGTGEKAQTSGFKHVPSRKVPEGATCCASEQVRPCYGAMTLHHIVPKQRIKARAAELGVWRPGQTSIDRKAALHDMRNLAPYCLGHHELVESASIRVEPSDLPSGFWEFVREYDLDGAVPRHLAERWAA